MTAGYRGGPVPAWSVTRAGSGPLVAVALHHGHDLRPEVAAALTVDAATRRREEDPFTGEFTRVGQTRIVVHRSRFEVDLNRPPEGAVYRTPDEAWGLDLWAAPPPQSLVAASLALHEAFYAALERELEDIARRHGRFVVYDIHAYNHRRAGPQAPPSPRVESPDLNLGTGNLDRARWGGVVDAFLEAAGGAAPGLDVRENVRFRGGWLPRWVQSRFGDVGCALAIELKKTFMDEWTGRPDPDRIAELGDVLVATAVPVMGALMGTAAARA